MASKEVGLLLTVAAAAEVPQVRITAPLADLPYSMAPKSWCAKDGRLGLLLGRYYVLAGTHPLGPTGNPRN